MHVLGVVGLWLVMSQNCDYDEGYQVNSFCIGIVPKTAIEPNHSITFK
jgi:hypothetical protein